jgi:hypothetical protein
VTDPIPSILARLTALEAEMRQHYHIDTGLQTSLAVLPGDHAAAAEMTEAQLAPVVVHNCDGGHSYEAPADVVVCPVCGDEDTCVDRSAKRLVYEDQLPSMTDAEYREWFKKSSIVHGVRMGPPVGKAQPAPDAAGEVAEEMETARRRLGLLKEAHKRLAHWQVYADRNDLGTKGTDELLMRLAAECWGDKAALARVGAV